MVFFDIFVLFNKIYNLMRNLILAMLVLLFAFAKATAQNLQGVATYQTQRHVELELDSASGMTSEMNKSIQEQLRKQFQRKYDLTFNKGEALWQEQEAELDKPKAPSSNGMVIMISGNRDIRYQNITDKNYTVQSDLMGKQFLIEDVLEKPNWILVKETKNIGHYTCFKATWTEENEEHSFENVDGEEKETTKMVTREVTAWYTLDIPMQHGPDEFWGLPGLILEVNDGKMSMMCTKVVLNPKDPIVINIPSKGKKVSQEEYTQISEEKSREMMDRMGGKRKKGEEGHTMSIRIGG
ncbi:MAG: GLPGLI family protein [Flavobacteriales bacterium]|jgi:GLPGLI family protein